MTRFRLRSPRGRGNLNSSQTLKLYMCALALAMLFVPAVSAQWLEEPQRSAAWSRPSFDPRNAVQQVRSAHSTPRTLAYLSPDADDFMIDTSFEYVPDICDNEAPECAFDGTNFLVVWKWWDVHGEQLGINCARVTPQGELVDTVCIAITRGDYWNDDLGQVAVAFDGSNYLVAWRDSRNGTYDYDIRGARVTPDGVVLDTPGFLISGAANDQWNSAVAFDGSNYMVVWEDERAGNDAWDIYGTRVTPAGMVLDTAGIAISTIEHRQARPDIAFDGTNFLVVWQDDRNGRADIFGARISRQGQLIDSTGLAISTATNYQWKPLVAFDGTNYFVCWDDLRDDANAEDVYGARVTPDGIVLDTAGVVVTDADNNQGGSSLLFDGTNYLVVWTDDRHGVRIHDVCGARVAPSSQVLDTIGFVISAEAVHPGGLTLAFDGANSLVVWDDSSTGRGSALYGSRVTPAGNVLDTLRFCLTPCAGYQQWPAVALGGTNYLVAWTDFSDFVVPTILCARVTLAGEVLDPSCVKISAATELQDDVGVAYDGTNFLVVWDDRVNGTECDVYGARVTPEGEVLDSGGFAICTVPRDKAGSRVAFDGTNYLVVWTDKRNGIEDIYGARVTPAGVVLDTAGFPISTATDVQIMPAVVSDGTTSLVLWTDYRNGLYSDIYGARVTTDGRVLDTAGIPVSTAAYLQMRPAAVFDGNDFFVVWEENRGGGAPDIYASRVTPTGAVLDSAGIPICTAAGSQSYSTVAFDGTDFTVAWMDFRASDFSDIYGARVSSAGVVLDSFVIVARDRTQSKPALARGSSGSMLLVYVDRTQRAGGRTYVSDRIWGNLVQRPGVAEDGASDLHRRAAMATVVRGVMVLDAAGGRRSTGSRAELLDISGRAVLDLKPGANDVRALAPGVYFVREARAQARAQTIRKVIVTR